LLAALFRRRNEFLVLRKFVLSRERRGRDDRPPLAGRRAEIVKQIPASYEVAAEPDPASIVAARARKPAGRKAS
jgi:hypothetical protein